MPEGVPFVPKGPPFVPKGQRLPRPRPSHPASRPSEETPMPMPFILPYLCWELRHAALRAAPVPACVADAALPWLRLSSFLAWPSGSAPPVRLVSVLRYSVGFVLARRHRSGPVGNRPGGQTGRGQGRAPTPYPRAAGPLRDRLGAIMEHPSRLAPMAPMAGDKWVAEVDGDQVRDLRSSTLRGRYLLRLSATLCRLRPRRYSWFIFA